MRVRGVRSLYVVRDPEAEAIWREDRIDRLLLEDGLAGQRQVCIGRHQEGTEGSGVPASLKARRVATARPPPADSPASGHRDTCHHVVEPSPQRRDVGSEIELALAQYGVQLQLLLFAHRLFSGLNTGCARASCRALDYAGEGLCVPQG